MCARVQDDHPYGQLRGICPHVPLGRNDIPVAHEVGPLKEGGRGGFWFYLKVSSFNLVPFVYR